MTRVVITPAGAAAALNRAARVPLRRDLDERVELGWYEMMTGPFAARRPDDDVVHWVDRTDPDGRRWSACGRAPDGSWRWTGDGPTCVVCRFAAGTAGERR